MSRVPQKINNIVEIFSFINGCRLRTPNVRGEGGRLNADRCGQRGSGGQKLAKSCGHLLCMTPSVMLRYRGHIIEKIIEMCPVIKDM